jgi:hypothetical protein
MKTIKRTRGIKEFKLPDAISRSTDKNGFTQVPNSFIRDPNISSKAKTILLILLSNKDGWTSHNEEILKRIKEGLDALKTGLTELEQYGYLLRIQFRDKKTKWRKGSFWAYTDVPWHFEYHKNLAILENMNYEIEPKSINGKSTYGSLELTDNQPQVDYPFMDQQHANNINIKKEEKGEDSDPRPKKEAIKPDRILKCPYNEKVFGKDFLSDRQGCIMCDENTNDLYNQCEIAHYNYLLQQKKNKEENK